jgi:peptidoglycan/xylan/chitin deacetylase (PgdA/CDA1 family)
VKLIASLSLDLDNEWAYLKTHGDSAWESHPSYLDRVVPRALDLLGRRRLCITCFATGQDAALDENREPLAALAAAGHEIANHSFHHEPWLHLYSEAEIEREIAAAEESIEKATGQRPRGFRGPGYSLSEATLRVLVRRGYRYDASTLPTFLGPLARAYYLMTTRLEGAEREKRGQLFGTFGDGLRPLRPYRWRVGDATLLEIPVTTFPGLRTPIHMSYVLYLSSFSARLAEAYFAAALRLCRAAGIEPSILLHPLDLLGAEDAPRLRFFPGMGLPAAAKIERVERCLDRLEASFEVCSVAAHAERAARRPDLREVEPRFQVGDRGAPPR